MLTAVDLSCERDERELFTHLGFEVSPGDVLHVQGATGAALRNSKHASARSRSAEAPFC